MAEGTPAEVDIQRQYYGATASKYEEMHGLNEHLLPLSFMISTLEYLGASSVLDVGSGTGRTLSYIKERRPDVRVLGVEPVRELREIGYASGLSEAELVDGDAMHLGFEDGQFDVVCEFAVLHHVKTPDKVVQEMLRVARKAVFISDSNNFGQGSLTERSVKQILNSLRLWKLADHIKTRGKGYTISEGDGLAYSYSAFDNYGLISRSCKSVHVLNTVPAGINPYRTASQVAILGIK